MSILNKPAGSPPGKAYPWLPIFLVVTMLGSAEGPLYSTNLEGSVVTLLLPSRGQLRFAGHTPRHEPLKEELLREQAKSGLTLVSVQGGTVYFAVFSEHALHKARDLPHPSNGSVGALTPDGSEIALRTLPPQTITPTLGLITLLGIVRADGSGLLEFPQVLHPQGLCWSNDKEKLVVGSWRRVDGPALEQAGLGILDIRSGTIQALGVHGFVTSQCWSHDGKYIAYSDSGNLHAGETNSRVRVLDLDGHTSEEIASGMQATWSPDGSWIAYYNHAAYFAIRPSGKDERKLFEKRGAISGLWWSPDSRIAAYVSQSRGAAGPPSAPLDLEEYWVFAKRLEDGSEMPVAFAPTGAEFQWVSCPEYFRK